MTFIAKHLSVSIQRSAAEVTSLRPTLRTFRNGLEDSADR